MHLRDVHHLLLVELETHSQRGEQRLVRVRVGVGVGVRVRVRVGVRVRVRVRERG